MALTWPPVAPDPDDVGPLAGRVRVYLKVPTPADVWDTARWDTARWDAGGAVTIDATCDCAGVQIDHGRDSPTSHVQPAKATFALSNADGLYTPWANTAARRRRWWLGAPVRIATPDGALFTGAIAEMAEDDTAGADDERVTTFTAYGPAGFLAQSNGLEQPEQGAGEKAGARLDRICNQARLPGWVERSFDVGQVAMQATTLAKGALEEAWLTADSDGGAVFDTPTGLLTFADLATMDNAQRYTEPQATFTDDTPVAPGTVVECMTALSSVLSSDHVINVVSIAAAGGTAHVATAPADEWAGTHTFQRHDLIHQVESHSQRLADTILARLSEAELLVEPLEWDPLLSAANWDAAHRLRPYDRIRIVRTRGDQYLDLTASIDAISHAISPDGWTATVVSSPGVQRFDFTRWDVARWDQTDAQWE